MPKDTTSERWHDEAHLRLMALAEQLKPNARPMSLTELIARQAGLSAEFLKVLAGAP